jgi:3-dehydroquinate dehydratase-2
MRHIVSTVVTLINGPNLNLLGMREPEIYGAETLAEVVARCVTLAGDLGLEVHALHSNHEGEIVEMIHAARGLQRQS